MSEFAKLSNELIKKFVNSNPKHTNTLILSIYGDTICPYGGTLWLGYLIKLVEPLGINKRLVRTSVYRLSEKGIMSSKKVGRKSFYSLTESGYRQYQSAVKRIYVTKPPSWDGRWRIVITSIGSLDPKQREVIEKELIWIGFNRLANGIHIHPTADIEVVKHILAELKINTQVVSLYATDPSSNTSDQLLKNCFNLNFMDKAYQDFVNAYEPILNAARQSINKDEPLDSQLCFLVRTLLINQFRIILLHEPELPIELLSENSQTIRARQILSELYLLLWQNADEYFIQIAKPEKQRNFKEFRAYYQRFGSLVGD